MKASWFAFLLVLVASALGNKWHILKDRHIDPACSSTEYHGDLGTMGADDCLRSASNQNVNYAVHHDGDCYVCLITERGNWNTWKYRTFVNATSFAKDGSPPSPPPTPTPPPSGPKYEIGGLHLELYAGTFTIHKMNVSVSSGEKWGNANNFSFLPDSKPQAGCHNLGDITLRIQPASEKDASKWAIYSSSSAQESSRAQAVSSSAIASHDITVFLNDTNQGLNPFFGRVPVRVVRSYEAAPNNEGFLLRFNITNTWGSSIKLGGLGLSMPQSGERSGSIKTSVWNDPHVGGDHGFVEWVRIVDDERTLLAVPFKDGVGAQSRPDGLSSRMEAWRPIMENTCGSETWEFTMHSEAWAAEWSQGKQWPYLWMSDRLNQTGMWPEPKTPWPAWHGHDTVPITDHKGISRPWNNPTSRILHADETLSVAVHIFLAEKGPRTRDAALAKAGKAVMHAVPGYVISPEMATPRLFVQPPQGARVMKVISRDESILHASVSKDVGKTYTQINIQGLQRGRCRVTVAFDDGTSAQAHYMVLPNFNEQIGLLGQHWANDAWLPRNYPDPFGRSASVMPYDRETRERVLDDSRAYDVGLSDDAGGGNPLGFAMKVAFAPRQDEVTRVDDYIKWTLYGVKPDTAKPPLKSLQIRHGEPGMAGQEDGIRMTMYYYNDAAHPSSNWSGHFEYDYKEQPKCGLYGIEGGPNWCMSESNANATYRVFNFPHHTASYYAMYRAARNHDGLKTYKTWQWYLERAANTTIKFGSPGTGVMDGTIFREVLRCLRDEASLGSDPKWSMHASTIESNMLKRAESFAAQEYPYGSEFSFDTTGQEEVVIWLNYFATSENKYMEAAKSTIDHILSYMRSSPTWPYNGGTRSWGDLGNNGSGATNGGKWMPSVGTASGFVTRGTLHYRSGLNAIPLIEWYRQNPDDYFLLEVAMGAQAGQLANIDEKGAPSMMLHMLPHVLDFDPHSGDYGLGFFGHTLEAGTYFVQHKEFGNICFLCDLTSEASDGSVTFVPKDSYRQRTYLEPLGLYLQAEVGTFKSISLNFSSRQVQIEFIKEQVASYSKRRIRLSKEATSRPGTNFKVVSPVGVEVSRGAYEVSVLALNVAIQWDTDDLTKLFV